MQLLMSSSMANCGSLSKPLIEIKQKNWEKYKIFVWEQCRDTCVCVGVDGEDVCTLFINGVWVSSSPL